jgi:hypothetical protein
MITEVRIRAFRAIDDPETCATFIEGHKKILENHGIDKVTSSNNEWVNNPAVFVLVVEEASDGRMFGGARIHAADGVHALPIEGAVGELDPNIRQMVKTLGVNGTGEICGLWNSKEVAGLGIGAIFSSRAAVAIGTQLGLSSVFSLSSPVTVRFSEFQGGNVVTTLGNNGTFYYPKLNLLATVCCIADIVNLPLCNPVERERIMDLRLRPEQSAFESYPFRKESPQIHISYSLHVKNCNVDEFKIPL